MKSRRKQADDYGLKTLRRKGRNSNAAVTDLEKLREGDAKRYGLIEALVSTHPAPSDRANRIREMIADS